MIARIEKRDGTREVIDVIHAVSNGSQTVSFHDKRLDGFKMSHVETDRNGLSTVVYYSTETEKS